MKLTFRKIGILVSQLNLLYKILVYIITTACCEENRKSQLFSYDKLYFLAGDINSSLVFASQTTNSLVGCSLFCSNIDSVTFYFIENTSQNCKCNNGVDKNAVFSETNTGVIYGCPENGMKVTQRMLLLRLIKKLR